MSQIVASLIAKIGADTSDFVQGAAQVKGGLTGILKNTAMLAAGIALLEQGFDQTVNAAQDYDQAIKGLMESTGGTADETSRLVQTMDDAGIGIDVFKRALKEMQKDGTEPSIEELARLSDEFLTLETGAERGQFLLDKFGKSGQDMARAMALGGDELRQMYGEMKGGLILTDQSVQASEEYRKNLDELSDTMEGFKVTAGNAIIPVLNQIADGMDYASQGQADYNRRLHEVIQLYGDHGDRANNMRVLMMQETEERIEAAAALTEHSEALMGEIDAMQETAMAIEELSINYQDLISSMMSMQSETDRYTETQAEANAVIEQANADLASGIISQQEHDAIITDSTARLNENAEAHKRWAAETVYSFAMARAAADGEISQGEGEILIAVGQQLGLFDEQTAAAMQGVNAAFESLDASNAIAVTDSINSALEALTGETWTIRIVTDTSGVEIPTPGGSSGGAEVRDSGGSGQAGQSYLIGTGAQPELFIPSTSGMFIPNADKLQKSVTLVNYGNIYLPDGAMTTDLMEAFA